MKRNKNEGRRRAAASGRCRGGSKVAVEPPMQGSVRSLARYILQVPIKRRKPHGIYGADTAGAADGFEPKGGCRARRGCWGLADLSVVTKENIATPF